MVDAAKSGGQELRVGEVFVECAGKTGFPGFGFFRQGDNCALRGEDGSQRGKCNSTDQRMAAGCILTDIREPKWESRLIQLSRNVPPGTEIPVVLDCESWSFHFTPDVRYGKEPLFQAFQLHKHHLFAWKWKIEQAPVSGAKRESRE